MIEIGKPAPAFTLKNENNANQGHRKHLALN